MPLLDSNDAAAIRKAIHASITEAQCPWDNFIEQDGYKWRAEQWVASRVDDVDSLEGDDLKHAQEAARKYCAHLLAYVVTPMKSESNAVGGSYSQDVMSPAANARRLLGEAESELAFLTEEDEVSYLPPYSGAVPTKATW